MSAPLATDTPQGAYCELQALVDSRFPAQKLQLAQRNRALSLLTGPNKTNFRGRGIDFEEVRGYQPGDDIRTIDWRVTARTGSAHTKLFREERERPVLIVADQRNSMFFGSRACCKSVLGAHYCALLSWAALNQGDRIGGLVFNDQQHREVRPRRSRRSVLALLQQVYEFNAALPLAGHQRDEAIADIFVDLRRIARPGCAVFIISDFRGALEDRALENLYQLSRHTEITGLHISDPLEASLPRGGAYTVTDGQSRTRLQTSDNALRRDYAEHFSGQLARLRSEYGKFGIPLIESQTGDAPAQQLFTYYGGEVRRKVS
jgi:uncharacterized protein (DUF58 family)